MCLISDAAEKGLEFPGGHLCMYTLCIWHVWSLQEFDYLCAYVMVQVTSLMGMGTDVEVVE